MNRIHIHLHVENLSKSVAFYRGLFGRDPDVINEDYAKWLADDPAVNLAISQGCGDDIGVGHLGVQFADAGEFESFRRRSEELGGRDQDNARCCYAQSDKRWLADPDGVAWEAFVTHGDNETFGGDLQPAVNE